MPCRILPAIPDPGCFSGHEDRIPGAFYPPLGTSQVHHDLGRDPSRRSMGMALQEPRMSLIGSSSRIPHPHPYDRRHPPLLRRQALGSLLDRRCLHPLTVIEQITYLLFLRLDENQTVKEKQSAKLGGPMKDEAAPLPYAAFPNLLFKNAATCGSFFSARAGTLCGSSRAAAPPAQCSG